MVPGNLLPLLLLAPTEHAMKSLEGEVGTEKVQMFLLLLLLLPLQEHAVEIA